MTGARTALGGPKDDLLLAYRGTAYFLRWLAQMPERAYELDRRVTIATVGYDARGWANLAEGLRDQRADPRTFDIGERDAAITLGVTLPPRALRHLVEHSAVHLAVEWRDLPAAGWGGSGMDHAGLPLSIARTPWLRARQTWLAAIDLGTGARLSDLPSEMRDRLMAEEGG